MADDKELQQAKLQLIRATTEAEKESAAQAIETIELKKELLEMSKEELALNQEKIDRLNELESAEKKRSAAVKASNKVAEDAIKLSKEHADAEEKSIQAVQKSTQTFLDAALGIKSSGNALTGLVAKLGEGAKGSDILKKSFSGVAGKTFIINNLFAISAGIMSKFTEETLKAARTSEQLVDSLARQAGIASNREQINSLLTMSQNSADANVTFAALGEATADLQAETQGLFGNILTGQKELIKFSAEMTGLGVDTSTTAKLFGEFGSILGKDAVQQITKLEKSSIKLARTFGMSANKMIADVSSLAEELAIYGDRADDVALGVTKIATVTKVSAGSILKFGQQFEFMPDAIAKTNKLNLIIGKNVLNSREMFNMMNDGRGSAEVLITAMDKIGPSLDENFRKSLPKMRGLFAEMGVGDKAAARLANTYIKASGAGRTFREEIDAQAKSAAENEEAMKPYADLMKKLAKFGEKFAVSMAPAADMLGSFLDQLQKIDPTTLKIIAGITAVGTLIAGGFAAASLAAAVGIPALAITGGTAAAAGIAGGVAAISDGVIVAQDGNISTTKIDSADDVRIVASKPGGPIANFGGSASSPRSIELVVSLFGKELIRNMVDLVESEQSTRRSLQDSRQGA